MEAKELMIGDYVNYRGQIIKVTSLYDKGGSNEVGWTDKEVVWVNAASVEPIPLTPEILKKNGFDFEREAFQEDENKTLEINIDDGVRWTINCNEYDILLLEYVHQLQHALKLCGIDKEIEL